MQRKQENRGHVKDGPRRRWFPSKNEEENNKKSDHKGGTLGKGKEICDLPCWENPVEITPESSRKSIVGSTTSQAGMKVHPKSSQSYASVSMSQIPPPPPAMSTKRNRPHPSVRDNTTPATLYAAPRDNLENMIVSFDNSGSSFEDEISLFDLDYDTVVKAPPPTASASVPRAENEEAASMAQEEEMIRLAMEQSLAETSSHTTNFVWKRGPTGRFVKVPINSDNGLCNRSTTTPSCTTMDESTSPHYLTTNNNNSSLPPVNDERLDRLEQELLNEAMNRSMRLDVGPAAEENAMIRLAVQRSLQQETVSITSAARPVVGFMHTPTLSAKPCVLSPRANGNTPAKPPTHQRMAVSPVRSQRGVTRSRSTEPDFVWTRTANNTFKKVPIPSATNPPQRSRSGETDELDRREQEMINEALGRSLRES